MSHNQTYLRIAGWLSSTDVFAPLTGWETQLIKRRPTPNSEYRFRLVDASQRTLVEVGAAIKVDVCRSSRIYGHDRKRLIAYVPAHSDAAELQLLINSRLLYRIAVAGSPPQVSDLAVDAQDPHRVRVTWRTAARQSYRAFALLIDSERRAIRVGSEITNDHFEFDALAVSGGPGCRVALIVSDGVRSTSCRSDSFNLPKPPPVVQILTPPPSEPISPLHPFSLMGRARDSVGRFLDERRLVWRIDGTVLQRGSCVATVEELEPGQRQIELEYEDEGGQRTTAQISLHVREPSKEEVDWRRASEAFASRVHGMSSFSRVTMTSVCHVTGDLCSMSAGARKMWKHL
jgi:hypothetical protein